MKWRRCNLPLSVVVLLITLLVAISAMLVFSRNHDSAPVAFEFVGYTNGIGKRSIFNLDPLRAQILVSNKLAEELLCDQVRVQVKSGNTWTNFPDSFDLCCEAVGSIDAHSGYVRTMWLPPEGCTWRATYAYGKRMTGWQRLARQWLMKFGVRFSGQRKLKNIYTPEYSL